jgi:hypothetical protein
MSDSAENLNLKKDDIALIMRPNFEGGDWNGTVDLNMMCMPSDKLDDEGFEELVYLMQGVITCFHLLNSDPEFGEKVQTAMDKMVESGELVFEPANTYENVINLSEWTATKGNA